MLPLTYSFFGKHSASGLSAKRGILNRIQPHHKTVGKTWEMILGINFAGFVSSVNSKIWPFLSKIRFLKSRPFYDFFLIFSIPWFKAKNMANAMLGIALQYIRELCNNFNSKQNLLNAKCSVSRQVGNS